MGLSEAKKTYTIDANAITALSTEKLILLRFTQAWDGTYVTQETFDAIDAELRRRADGALDEIKAVRIDDGSK
jgi:hypothetical protein